MAQIEPTDKGKKKKGAQKKKSIHVDFTPMVDMNMLLITFFMLCTTMLKSQTLQILLPSNNDKIEKDQQNQADVKQAVTLILDTQYDANNKIVVDENGNAVHNIYYYSGSPDDPSTVIEGTEHFLDNNNEGRQGIRKLLYNRHKDVMQKYDQLKIDYRDKKITKEQFDEQAKANATDENLAHPVVIIKPGPNVTYEALVYAIDELNLNQITKYSIETTKHQDTLLLEKYQAATGNQIIRPDVRKAK